MVAGGPGDHPLIDVLNNDIEVYGVETDKLLKRLGELLSKRELDEFWDREIGFKCDKSVAHHKFSVKVNWAEERAKNSGWETNDT